MSIALESGRGLGGGGPRFGRAARCGYAASPPASAGRGGSSSVGRDSDSPAAAAQWEWDGDEVEGGDGEVQSSYKGSPFDTMDALQEALPFRKGVCKFYNGKSGSFGKLPDAVIPSPPEKNLPKPETPSPRKRKGLLPFTFKWGKPQRKEIFPEDVVDSPTNCRKMVKSPAATSSSGSNSGSNDEHYRSQKPSSHRLHRMPSDVMGVFASTPAPRPPQLFPAHMRSQSMLDLQDVTDSTALVTPRDKRMKN
ncbi:protein OXIDATIVE STRESS 3 LIKE 1-like [Phragmites australis]|uniref:protein OXIDATIVE STRESS 3 LIKE 1-like n=1 Tax=Phragmites australis TaxID=29695 RepID=UPI002D792722|nr:protein OXIDATIVE STRESS 3 LIKE 1-like [Phragmites australis]